MEFQTPMGTFKSWEEAAEAVKRADMDPYACIDVVGYVAVDPATGCHLRAATIAEWAAYISQPGIDPAFRRPVRLGAVLVDEYRGPGQSHTPGRFLA